MLYDPWVSVPYDDWDIPFDGGWAGSNYDDGGWAGSNYYDGGGWAGSNYYDDSEPEELLILDF